MSTFPSAHVQIHLVTQSPSRSRREDFADQGICYSLAWTEMYMVFAAFVDQFDFELDSAGAKDVECMSDQFIVGVADTSGIKTWVTEAE